MKKIITFIVLVISFAGMAQAVTITTTQTPTELINNVLISSPCFVATNVTASTGSNFGSTKGIGYFSNIDSNNPNLPANPNFPFKSGVVLTTGDVTKVPSPNDNVLSDGVAAWPGDTQMQDALLSQGVSINSINASSLQFEFIATTTTFNMSFIFASEEYGASQCNYSDAFAFLIKDITPGFGTSYINSANVPFPAAANTPITVATIRDATYNPNCSSVNEQFFGAYNGGGFGPAINFNGQTVPLTASAPLTVGRTYRVKLVIADGNGNVGYDSAIFLEAKTLNIGAEVLGLDYVSANANAGRNGVCAPVPITSPFSWPAGFVGPNLAPDVPLPAGTTYQWKKRLSGVYGNIPSQTSATLNVCALTPYYFAPELGLNYYALTYTKPGCVAITDYITIEVFQPINALAVLPPLTKCNTGAANYSFDLTKMATIITTNNTPAFANDDLFGYTITFHTSITNADNNIAVINPYSVAGGPLTTGVTMYAKIKNNLSGCYTIRSFDLKTVLAPIIDTQPADLTLCGITPSPGPRADFDFNPNILDMLGSQDASIYSFSYHNSLLGAQTSATTDAIYVPPSNIKNTTSTTIYVRLENKLDTSCAVTTSFTVTVTPLAYVDIFPDVIVCDNFVLPVLTQAGAQYWSLTGGPATAGNIPYNAGDIIPPGATPTTIWVYNENGICKTNDSFKITKANLPLITPASATVCQTTGYTLPALAYGTYYMLPGGPTAVGQSSPPANLFGTPGAKVIYVWFENLTTTPPCTQEETFTITITPFTLLQQSNYPDKFACSSYTFNPPFEAGITYYNGPNKTGGVINLPYTFGTLNSQKTIYVYKESPTNTNCTDEVSFTIFIGLAGTGFTAPSDVDSCTPYPLPALDFGQYRDAPNGGGNLIADGTVVGTPNTSTTIYFYVPGQACTGSLSFQVNISLPALTPISDVTVCDSYTLPFVPDHPNGKYYYSSGGAGAPLLQGTVINNFSLVAPFIQQVYFYEQATIGSCFVQDDFLLTINPSPQISQRPNEVATCNQDFVLDDLEFGEYYKLQGGPTTPNNPVLQPGDAITGNDIGFDYSTIYAYSSSANPSNGCVQEYSRKIYIVNTAVNDIADVTACDSYSLPNIVGLGDYWTAAGGGGPQGTGTKITLPYTVNATTTLYVYAEAPYPNDLTRPACFDQDPFIVTILRTPDLIPQTSPISVCDSYTIPQYNDPMFAFTPTNPGVITKFYQNPNGAAGNLPTEVYTPGQVITNTNSDFSTKTITLYPYAELLGAPAPCFENQPFVVTINRTPVIVPTEVNNVNACDTYSLPALTIGKYYSAATHLPGEELLVGYTITDTAAPTTVYVYAETGTTPNCFAPVEDFVVTISKTPVFTASEVSDVFECNSYTLPALSIPGANYYTAPNGPNGTGTLIPASQSYTNNVTVYPYAANAANASCFASEDIVISIYNVIEPLAVTACDNYQLPDLADPNANYYTQPNKGGTLLPELSFITSSQPVYINGSFTPNSTCTDESSFYVTIVPTPVIDPINAVYGCDSYTIPAYNNPMFTSTNPITKFYKNPGGPAGNLQATDEFLEDQIIPWQGVGTVPYVFPVYAYSAVGSVPCWDEEPFVVTINKAPVLPTFNNVTACDFYELPYPLAIGKYYPNAAHNPSEELDNLAERTLTTSQTVYVYVENGGAPNVCSDSASFLVTINNTPQFTIAEVADVSKCNSYTLPTLSIPGAKYFEGPNGTGNQIILPKTYTSDALIYAYANTGTTPDCAKSEDIVISIYNVIELPDVTICGGYTLPTLADPNANYYNISGGTIAAGTTLTTTQTVIVRGTSPNSPCTDESDFIVTINGQPIANPALDSVCDNDSSPYDGITPYDLTNANITAQILGSSQDPADFTITYFQDFNRTVQIIDPTTCSLPIVYVFVTNNLSPTCPTPEVVTITVIPLPDPKLDVPPICIDSETGIVTNSVIESGYNSAGNPSYTIVWSKASDGTVVSNSQTFSTDVPGDYILNVTSNAVTTCASAPVPFTVIESAKPAVTPPITFDITGWFTNSQTITVIATPYVGDGSNFAYSLDGQTPQDDNVFYNVGPGAHEITVIDKNGCGTRSLPIPLELVTSPAAFTPNGDGINDRWDIKGDISYSTLSIFDRFGRLLKQLNQNSGGWDGTINSQTLPADDYWFSVNYVDSSGAAREYKSHFSLIR